jgi:hypothetical protein
MSADQADAGDTVSDVGIEHMIDRVLDDCATAPHDSEMRRDCIGAIRRLAAMSAAVSARLVGRLDAADGQDGRLSLLREALLPPTEPMCRHPPATGESVLVLTPVKDASTHLDRYFDCLGRLDYPPELLSLGLLESDSSDDTWARLTAHLPALLRRYRRATLWQRDFGFRFPSGVSRWALPYQIPRRQILARARNHLLFRALEDEAWVLWLDVDVIDYPRDLLHRLLATGRDIVHPHCVQRPGGATFDWNAWRDEGRVRMDQLRGGPDLVRLDSVGGTVLLIRADLHRDGLIFPPFPYGRPHPRARRPGPWGAAGPGEIETEGLGLMAADMGYQCWGMPNLEVIHADR